jgi:hypothetical protein
MPSLLGGSGFQSGTALSGAAMDSIARAVGMMVRNQQYNMGLMHDTIERKKERRFREEQRKKAEKDSWKKFWTSTAIGGIGGAAVSAALDSPGSVDAPESPSPSPAPSPPPVTSGQLMAAPSPSPISANSLYGGDDVFMQDAMQAPAGGGLNGGGLSGNGLSSFSQQPTAPQVSMPKIPTVNYPSALSRAATGFVAGATGNLGGYLGHLGNLQQQPYRNYQMQMDQARLGRMYENDAYQRGRDTIGDWRWQQQQDRLLARDEAYTNYLESRGRYYDQKPVRDAIGTVYEDFKSGVSSLFNPKRPKLTSADVGAGIATPDEVRRAKGLGGKAPGVKSSSAGGTKLTANERRARGLLERGFITEDQFNQLEFDQARTGELTERDYVKQVAEGGELGYPLAWRMDVLGELIAQNPKFKSLSQNQDLAKTYNTKQRMMAAKSVEDGAAILQYARGLRPDGDEQKAGDLPEGFKALNDEEYEYLRKWWEDYVSRVGG